MKEIELPFLILLLHDFDCVMDTQDITKLLLTITLKRSIRAVHKIIRLSPIADSGLDSKYFRGRYSPKSTGRLFEGIFIERGYLIKALQNENPKLRSQISTKKKTIWVIVK